MAHTEIKRDDMGLVYLGLIALCVAGGYFAWLTARSEVSYYALKWAWIQLGAYDWPFAPHAIGQMRQQAALLAAHPGTLAFSQLTAILNSTGFLFIWIPVLLSLYGAYRAQRHPANRTRRSMTAVSLPRIMAKHSPAVVPTLYYGDLLNDDAPEHRSSINPEEWVARHALLIDGRLDRPKCRALLSADLGSAVDHLQALSAHEKALFAVFGARLLADGKDHKVAQELLDALNRSCHTGTWQGKPGYPDLSLCDAAFRRYASHPDAQAWLTKHPYPRTLLHAMHKAALAYGRLPSAQFRWLKGLDRALWYALNTTGRKTPFMESAAVFTHTLWEEFAFSKGYRLTEPYVDDAIDGLEAYLIKIGLMPQQSKQE